MEFISCQPEDPFSNAISEGLFPPSKKIDFEVNGINTEILLQSYDDRVFILISQINKIGNLLNAWGEPKSDGNYLYFVQNLIGRRDDPLLNIYARQLVERLFPLTKKPLVLGITLKEEARSKEFFEAIINKVLEMVIV